MKIPTPVLSLDRLVVRACIALIVLALFSTACHLRADDYDTVRLRYKEILDGGSSFNTSDPDIAARLALIATAVVSNGATRNPTTGTGFWDKLNTSPAPTDDLWSDLPGANDGPNITASYTRLRAMALAYTTHGSALEGNATLLADTISALDWMYANRYDEDTNQSFNWWYWQIGIPMALNDTVTLLYDHLSPTQRGNYMTAVAGQTETPNSGTSTNRMWFCKINGLLGVLSKNVDKVNLAHDGLPSIFSYDTSGDGIFTDGSFRFHGGHPYNGGYGLSLISEMADYLYIFDGSGLAVTAAQRTNVYNWLYDSFEPMVFKGEVFDMSRGREVSRPASTTHSAGRRMIRAFMRVAQFAPASDAAHYKRVAKHWLQTDTTFSSSVAGFAIYDTLLAQAILNDSSIAPRSDADWYFQFPMMDRTVVHRPAWAAALASHSTRTKNYESQSGENLKGWHTGAGMLYVYTGDLNQFSDNFWPTVHQHRLPGTTVEAGHAPAQGSFGGQSFVGGVESWSGFDGVSAMSIGPSGRTLRGNKAWFFFDDEIVALGAGITASGGSSLETVIENRKLKSAGDNAFSVNGSAALATLQTAPGTPAPLSSVNYAHLAGNVATEDGLGYFFPTSANLKGMRETRTANWSSINTPSPSTNYTNHFLTLWFDHGINPASGNYAYAILPGASSAATASYAATPDFTVLENSTSAQAVKETTLNQVGAVFWNDAVKTVGSGTDAITSNKKAAVLVAQPVAGEVRVSVSDPTQLNTGTTTITLGASAAGIVSADPSLNVVSLAPIQFTFNANGAKGRTQRAHFGTFGHEVWSAPVDNSPSAAVTYTGTWTHSADAAYYNATKSVSNTVGNMVKFDFNGTGARLYVRTASSLGKLSITIDNGPATVVDCYAPTETFQTRIFQISGLPAGAHSLRATVATKNSESSGNAVGIDYFEVRNGWTPVDNPPSTEVAYTGTWTHSADTAYYNGTKSVSNVIGNYAQFTFSGTGARLYVRTAPSLGKLSISINGGAATLVDCYSATSTFQVMKFEVTGLTPGTHTLRATVATRNPVSSGNFVGIDCFEWLP